MALCIQALRRGGAAWRDKPRSGPGQYLALCRWNPSEQKTRHNGRQLSERSSQKFGAGRRQESLGRLKERLQTASKIVLNGIDGRGSMF